MGSKPFHFIRDIGCLLVMQLPIPFQGLQFLVMAPPLSERQTGPVAKVSDMEGG